MPGPGTSRAIALTRWWFNLALVADLATRWLAAWMVAAAVGVLALKVSGGLWEIRPWHILATGLPVLAAAALRAYLQRYDAATAAAWLDLKGFCGGRVIDAASRGAAVEPPAVKARVRVLPLAARLVIPAVLVVASLLVPWSVRAGKERSGAAIQRKAAVVKHRIENARRLGIIDEEQARLLEEQLEGASAGAAAAPEAAAEAVDQVQAGLDRKVLEAAEKGLGGMQAARTLEQASGMKDVEAGLVDEALDKAMEGIDPADLPPELREAIEKMGKAKEGGADQGSAGMDPQKMKELGKVLGKLQGKKAQEIAKASDLVADPKAQAALAQMMEGRCPRGQKCDPAALGMDGPGKGGISQGPGEAPLSFGDETSEAGARFEPVPFEPGKGFLPSLVPGSKQGSGSTNAPAEFQPPGRTKFEVEAGEGGLSAGSGLSPYHDDVVSEYFENEGSAP